MKTPIRMIGLMSGTSADGIDVAVVRLGRQHIELEHFEEHPLSRELREGALRLAEPALHEIDDMGALDREFAIAFAAAARSAIGNAGLTRHDIAAIASHGQTIRHRPQGIHGGRPFTAQIGCISTIAEQTGITTIGNFRQRDIAAGGEGAPLVPFVHQQLCAEHEGPVAILNIGGIANVSCISEGHVAGFDTGPGNMVMDGLMLAISDGRHGMDRDGQLAASGHVCEPLLNELLRHPFFERQPPKSCGREEFGAAVVDRLLAQPNITDADRMRTALELTVRTVADSRRWMKPVPDKWFICGGGAFNSALAARLAETLNPAAVATTETLGIPPHAMEAAAFAVLGWQTLLGRPNTLASVTGASHDSCGGHIAPGDNWAELLTWTRSHTD